MTQNEKFQIQRRNTLRNLWQKLSGTPDFPVKLVLAALYLMGAAYVCVKQAAWRTLAGNIPLPSPLLKAAMEHALLAYLLAGAAALLALLLYPFGRRAAKDQLQCIGLVNHAGVPPDLLRKRRDKDNPRVTVWEFRNNSIPLQEWEKRQAAIETALGLTIVKLAYAKGKSRVLVYAVSAGDDLPEVLKWKDSYLSPKSFVLVLGESYTGPVTVNLAHIPHILLGGSTGSGKSVLLKLLLMQALHKGAEVYITDFKGGVDFPKVWHEKCRMCFTEENLRYTLDQLVAVLEYRKNAFKALGCPNIDAYNEIAERPLQRLIFACDEVAEMLDKTGADNERKKLLAQIENKLSTIARRGGRSASISFLPRRGRMRPSSPVRYATTWISVFAAGRTACFLKLFSTTPAPPIRYPRMHGAVSSPETVRCFKATCSTRGSFNGVIPCRAERSPMTTAQGFPITR